MTGWSLLTPIPSLALVFACNTAPLPTTASSAEAGSSNASGNAPQNGSASGTVASSGTSAGGNGSAAGNGGAATGSGGAGGSGTGSVTGGSAGAMASGGDGGAAESGEIAGGAPASSAGGASAEAGSGGVPGGAGAPEAVWDETFPTFTKHEIATFQSGYAMVVFDVDQDELPDVVALSSGATGLAWFKNPSWERFAITTGTDANIYLSPHDVDGDGDLDLAIASDFSFSDSTVGTVSWAEAPDDPTVALEWPVHFIDSVPTSHRLRWGDIDGDGIKELLDLPIFGAGSSAPEHAGAVELKAYAIPADPTGTWEADVLDDSLLEVAHGINLVDWDGDAAEDILTAANAGVYLFRPSLAEAPQQLGAGLDGPAPDRGSSEVCLGTLGGARFLATIEPWHGTNTVVYTPGASDTELWMRRDLGTDFQHGHGLQTADLNGDGYDEIIGGGGEGDMALLIYRYVPSADEWETIDLDVGGVAISEIDVKDMNGDGTLDVVAIGGSTNNLVWYEND